MSVTPARSVLRTTLQIALFSGDQEEIVYLLNDEPNALQRDEHANLLNVLVKNLQLHNLPVSRWINIFRILQSNGAKIENIEGHPYVPNVVLRHGNVQILVHLLSLGFELKEDTRPWEVPHVHAALSNPDTSMLRHLVISMRKDINTTNYFGQTPAWIAAAQMSLHTLKLLIGMGADLNAACHEDKSPLAQVLYRTEWDREFFRYLMRRSNVHSLLSALQHAFELEQFHLVNQILSHAAVAHNLRFADEMFTVFYFNRLRWNHDPWRNGKMLEYLRKCEQEVKYLQNMPIIHGTTLHNLYMKIINGDYRLLRNQRITSAIDIEQLAKALPIYGLTLKQSYRTGIRRLSLIESALTPLGRLLGVNGEYYQHQLWYVMEFLDDTTLQSLVTLELERGQIE